MEYVDFVTIILDFSLMVKAVLNVKFRIVKIVFHPMSAFNVNLHIT